MAEKNIYAAINAVMQEVGAVGKNKQNKEQKYVYRGIDDVMTALAPAMQKNGVFVTPRIIDSHREEKEGRYSKLLYSVLTVEYTFHALDGSSVTAVVMGEGMDSGDKATNKAMSAAFKYALLQTFCIPTEELIDSEKDSPEVTRQEPTRAAEQLAAEMVQAPRTQAAAYRPQETAAKPQGTAQNATEAPQTVNNPPKTETPGKSAVERVQSFVVKSRMKAESIMTVCKHYGVNTIGELTEEQAQDYINQAQAKGVEI